MSLDDLASALSDLARPGLDEDLARRLGVRGDTAMRGGLLAQLEGARNHLAVHLLGAWVEDDTDAFGDGEIYWWSIPTLVDAAGQSSWDPLAGLPTGAPPHRVGSREWMTNLRLARPALLAVIPPDEAIASCVVRLGFYDDDRAPANVPVALKAGLEALAALPKSGPGGAGRIVEPVRAAILRGLRAEQDDVLLDQDLAVSRADGFGAGLIGSTVTGLARVYYLVRDVGRTHALRPLSLDRGQSETLRFEEPMRRGGRLAVFARGADVQSGAFDTLRSDAPFANVVLDTAAEARLRDGFTVLASGPAKLVAFYTPPA